MDLRGLRMRKGEEGGVEEAQGNEEDGTGRGGPVQGGGGRGRRKGGSSEGGRRGRKTRKRWLEKEVQGEEEGRGWIGRGTFGMEFQVMYAHELLYGM